MKTTGSGNPNRRATVPCNRAHGAEGQNSSPSIKWAEKQEKIQPKEMCFFLTSPFIELAKDSLQPSLSASIGVAVYPQDGETIEALLRTADRELYEMKPV
jgi:GGDEF domain-containing protein